MVAAAIWSSDRKCLTTAEIFTQLRSLFVFFGNSAYTGWESSVRHTLSVYPCFIHSQSPRRSRWKVWSVDLSLVPETAFVAQSKKQGNFKDDLFDQIGIPGPSSLSPRDKAGCNAARNLSLLADNSTASSRYTDFSIQQIIFNEQFTVARASAVLGQEPGLELTDDHNNNVMIPPCCDATSDRYAAEASPAIITPSFQRYDSQASPSPVDQLAAFASLQ
ncbi:hypothetical protein CAPTEDRAFT_199454 [Capitella teleta]|uniref:Fork-head domain-containing protein n=1 Tax=Capitella teleta TaxID=283909 RepID=R7VGD8_CAPTE|nr:hypothetical protein CAPTEDRAFT_199454 [Capitella teleta]|eukprot:ELU15376.1 hypothetical protein CAPTEDRAFT_199454 [Capitella teleta]